VSRRRAQTHLGVALGVLEQVEEEDGGLLGPPRLAIGAVFVLGLYTAPATSQRSTMRCVASGCCAPPGCA